MRKYKISNFRGSNAYWRIDVSVNLVIISGIDNRQPLSYRQHVWYSLIYTTYIHTFVFIVGPKVVFDFKNNCRDSME